MRMNLPRCLGWGTCLACAAMLLMLQANTGPRSPIPGAAAFGETEPRAPAAKPAPLPQKPAQSASLSESGTIESPARRVNEKTTAGRSPARLAALVSQRATLGSRKPPAAPHPSLPMNRYVGVGSCASAGCHGGAGPPDSPTTAGSEYSIWVQEDRHARAYSVLFDPLAQQMAQNLKIGPAHRAAECLSCHGVTAAQDELAPDQRFTVSDGVGCEACHGPAEKWLEPHKQYAWQRLTASQKSEYGFWNTDDLLTRTRICATCHVGAPGREVNHDLIAAGHPPLKFEMSAYHARMPRHWSSAKDRRENSPALDAKLWAVGQVASAEMAVRLLKDRAADEQGVWPEFSEYGCFACHHDLQPASWRQQRGYAGRDPGALAWGTWSVPLLPALARETGGVDFAALEASLASLQGMLGTPYGAQSAVADRAGETAGLLAAWAETLNQQQFTDAQLKSMMSRLATDGRPLSSTNWDAATQVYLGLVALEHGRSQLRGRGPRPEGSARVIAELHEARSALAFPAPADGARFDSPQTFGPDRTAIVQEALQRIQAIIEAGN